MSVTYYLRDHKAHLVRAWQDVFADVDAVQAAQGDIFEQPADALVSPANSFGFMDGGIDLIYSMKLGWQVQERLQELLRREYHGELLVGQAVILPTDHPEYPYLISAPTMRTPMEVSDTLNAYLAFRAALRVINQFNAENGNIIKRVLCPGLATTTGRMPAKVCAKQMHAAYDEVMSGRSAMPRTLDDAIMQHFQLTIAANF